MSLILNILKIRKAFSEPSLPHNPKHFILMSDLEYETKLTREEIFEALFVLEQEGLILYDGRASGSVSVREYYRELFGV